MPVQGHGRLQPQRVPGAQPGRPGPHRAAPIHQLLPQSLCPIGSHHQFTAIFPGVAGTTDDRLHPPLAARPTLQRNRHHLPAVVFQGTGVETDHRFGQLEGPRSLHGDHGRFQRLIGALHVRGKAVGDPGEDFLAIRGVDHHQVEGSTFVAQMIDQDVVEHAPLVIGDQRVTNASDGQICHAACHQRIQKWGRLAAVESKTAHMRNIKQSGGVAGGTMFVDDGRVLHGHLPPAEFDHPCPVFHMPRVQSRPGQFAGHLLVKKFRCHAQRSNVGML